MDCWLPMILPSLMTAACQCRRLLANALAPPLSRHPPTHLTPPHPPHTPRARVQKWEAEEKEYPLAGMPTPSQDEVQRFVDALKAGGVPVLCNKTHLKTEA